MQMTFRNEQDGMESRIKLLNNGKYSVTLWDMDVNECVPVARHFQELERAIDCAREWTNLSPSPKTITVEV